VLVATLQAVHYHGGFTENGGLGNLKWHINNIKQFGLPLVVAINKFKDDTDEDIKKLIKECDKIGVKAVLSDVHDKGVEGGKDLAIAVKEVVEKNNAQIKYLYSLDSPIKEKIRTLACEVYGATGVDYDREAEINIKLIEDLGHSNLPICVAKTPKSLSDNAKLRGVPKEPFRITVNKVKLAAGAEFIVVISGNILTMPGLPKISAAERIQVDSKGRVIGLA
jgi:formate--tetrahydrofolate ligase